MSTKPCIVCGEQIQTVASRCPHCHQVQSKVYQFFNTSWGAGIIFVIAAIAIVYFAMKEPVRWSEHTSAVTATDVKMTARSRTGGTDMTCIALLKNAGSHSWREPVVEASFFSADGQLIDTATQRLSAVVLLAGSEARVRVLEQAAWEPSEYARCTVSVRHATLN
jgi:hypothetical protein